jgi:hypothetical protein
LLIYTIYNHSTLIFSVYFHKSSVSASWQRVYNMGTVKISLIYTLQIPLHYSTNIVFNSQVQSSSNTNFPWLSPTENSELCHSLPLSLLVPVHSELTAHSSRYIATARTTQKCGRKTTEKTSHVIVTSPVHWRADFCLVTSYKNSFTEIQLLLLRNVPCLLSCCLAMCWSNTPLYWWQDNRSIEMDSKEMGY